MNPELVNRFHFNFEVLKILKNGNARNIVSKQKEFDGIEIYPFDHLCVAVLLMYASLLISARPAWKQRTEPLKVVGNRVHHQWFFLQRLIARRKHYIKTVSL